jgi:hypothetical protein
MAKVITFSRTFPAYHPRKGEPTNFVEKVLYGLIKGNVPGCGTELLKNPIVNIKALNPDEIKSHTIREGNRFKKGDYFSPAIWGDNINPKNGRTGPYQSKQIKFAPDIEIKNVWDIEMKTRLDERYKMPYCIFLVNDQPVDASILALHDGLDLVDLLSWFIKPFKGQIICWNENIKY